METAAAAPPEVLEGLRMHTCGNYAHIERDTQTEQLYYHCYHCQENLFYERTVPDPSDPLHREVVLPFQLVTYSARERDKIPIQQMVNKCLPFDKTLPRSLFYCDECKQDTPAVLIPTKSEDLLFARVCEFCLHVVT